MKSFLQNLILSVTFGVGWVLAAISVACLGLWLLDVANGQSYPNAMDPNAPQPRGTTAMR